MRSEVGLRSTRRLRIMHGAAAHANVQLPHARALHAGRTAARRCRKVQSAGQPQLGLTRAARLRFCAQSEDSANRQLDDPNWVQTALSEAIAAEDFGKAATCVCRYCPLPCEAPCVYSVVFDPCTLHIQLQTA